MTDVIEDEEICDWAGNPYFPSSWALVSAMKCFLLLFIEKFLVLFDNQPILVENELLRSLEKRSTSGCK